MNRSEVRQWATQKFRDSIQRLVISLPITTFADLGFDGSSSMNREA